MNIESDSKYVVVIFNYNYVFKIIDIVSVIGVIFLVLLVILVIVRSEKILNCILGRIIESAFFGFVFLESFEFFVWLNMLFYLGSKLV